MQVIRTEQPIQYTTSAASRIRIVSGLVCFVLVLANLSTSASDVDRYRDASYYVTTGTVVGMTLLIDFPDDQAVTNYNASVMNNLMTQIGFKGFGGVGWTTIGSLRDYFLAASSHRFDFICSVFNFSTNYNNGGGSNGYYRASLTKTNYTVGHEAAFFAVVSNALAAAKAQGFDFSTLTTDSHGNVVGLTVLYANTNTAAFGPAGQYMDWSPPTNGSTPFYTADGVNFRWYAISRIGQDTPSWPEINITSHECSHMITGWSDMDSRTETGVGNGSFCVMSCGGGGNPQNPPLPSAYLRSRVGWIDIVDVASNTPPQDAMLTSARSTCYRYKNPASTNEYFLVELRDSSDAGGTGYALAIWHVDEASVLLSNYYGSTNTPTKHCRCQLIQADSKLDLENSVNDGTIDDLYFSPNVDRFDDYTTPATHWWNGSNSFFAIGQISSRSPALRFCINPLVLNANRTVRGVAGIPFSYALQTRAGIAFTLTAVTLPGGLSLVGNTITGTPTSAMTTNVMLIANTGATSYTYPLTIKIVDGAPPVIDSPLNVGITFPGCYLRYDLTATGADPITYACTNGPTQPHNTLLSGCSFTNGTLSGALSGVGYFTNNLIITASNVFGCDTQVLNIALSYYSAPAIANGSSMPSTGHLGTAYNFAFTYSDNPAPVFSVTVGALPTGLSLSYDGVISGTPTVTGSYTGLITAGNTSTSVFTQAFAITISPWPAAITYNPVSRTNDPGTQASFIVTATGTPPLFYQWQTNGINIAYATNATYTIASVTTRDAGSYRCLVSNIVNIATSAIATLTVSAPPTCTLTVVNSGNGQSSLGGSSPFVTVGVVAGATTQIVYTATDWHRILMLTRNNVPVDQAVGTRVYTQAFDDISADISNNVMFAQATTNQTGYPNVPITWLTNWAESSVISDSAFNVHSKYLIGLNPTTSNTYTLNIESVNVLNSNIITVIKRIYSGGLSPDGMHGYLKMQATDNLRSPFTNLISTEVTGATVFDETDRKAYTNTIGDSNQFFRAVIQ
jgi:M6 family metalloprotease-like protein